MRSTSKAIAVLVAVVAMLAPSSAQADHEGCYVIGEVWGLDTLRTCTYTASTPSQTVYVGTPYDWRIWVLRSAPNGAALDVTLAEGTGPPAGLPAVVTPVIGETVNVTMSFGCTSPSPYCGTIGFLGAGLEQDHA